MWHALYVLSPIAIIVYSLTFWRLGNYDHFFFDPKHNNDPRLKAEGGDFEPHAKRYQDLSKLAITLSAAALAFLVSVTFSEKPMNPAFTTRIQAVAPIVAGFFGATIALLVAFMLNQALNYESYCHSAEHSTYKRWKYALSVSLGVTGLIAFVLGFLWLAHSVFLHSGILA
jgi:hypothetical protein